VQIFDERFGPYPFTELDLVSTPTSAYGIEYPGMLAIAVRLYGPNSEYPPAYLESTVAHEVAHQWFYSVVGNDQQGEPWLDEALAQYSTTAYYGDLYGPEAASGFRASLYERWQRVEDAPIPIGLSVGDYSAKEYGAIVYGRGPLFVEALADAMGQPAFDRFLRDYYQTHAWGVATTIGFHEQAEDWCGCDLDALFEEWVYPP
jgi:aminopeptidase N